VVDFILLNLKMIAELAQVSVSTVSRILNGKGRFSEETRNKVLRIAKEYLKPSAPVLKAGSISYKIAVFVPNMSDFVNDDPSSSADLNDLKEELEKAGHQIILIPNTGKPDKASIADKMIQDRSIDGAIVFDPYVEDELVQSLIHQRIPYLTTNGTDHQKEWNYIDYNHRHGAAQAIEYLYTLGHREIGIISGPQRHLVSLNRLQGCESALLKLGRKASPKLIYSGDFSLEHGYRSALDLLTRHSSVTAIFAFNDMMAYGAMRAASELGRKIPEQLSLIGFDDLKLSEFITPALTTVRRFKYDINSLLVRLMSDLISNPNMEKVGITLKTDIVIRESFALMNNLWRDNGV
jgi:DNA-binding LacI/PurR family transcriptional regulator